MATRKGKSVENPTLAFVAQKIAVECCIKKVRKNDHIRLNNDGYADATLVICNNNHARAQGPLAIMRQFTCAVSWMRTRHSSWAFWVKAKNAFFHQSRPVTYEFVLLLTGVLVIHFVLSLLRTNS